KPHPPFLRTESASSTRRQRQTTRVDRKRSTSDMKICGACVRELPDGSYSEEQRGLRQSIRRCEECVAAGNQLVLMKKGRTRSEEDDCPICQLPLLLDTRHSSCRPCCMKEVCNGCLFAAAKRGMLDCPFCRASVPDESQSLAMIRKRVAAGDPVAICTLGAEYRFGGYGLKKDVTRAVELYERAAELGEKDAHYNLGALYDEGTDVETDTAKAIRHYEAAAMCGHVYARHNLGHIDGMAGNRVIAQQHFLISAKLGSDDSLRMVKAAFMAGLATKADFASALRGHQNAVDEIRPQEDPRAGRGALRDGRRVSRTASGSARRRTSTTPTGEGRGRRQGGQGRRQAAGRGVSSLAGVPLPYHAEKPSSSMSGPRGTIKSLRLPRRRSGTG
ncbi:hypothetical protein THAOC_30082, partial [Thalassiosira oceanica]